MKAQLASARHAFEAAFSASQPTAAWREGIGEPADLLLDQLYCTDLLATTEVVDSLCAQANPIDLAVRSGTPILRFRAGIDQLALQTALVAWKNCASANRALRASRPFLDLADRVCVAGVGDEVSYERLDQIAAQLRLDGYNAGAVHLPQSHSNPGGDIITHAFAIGADLVVSGAKGERSLRERLLGDVTDKLAAHAGFSWLMCA